MLTLAFWAVATATAGWAGAGFAASWALALAIAVAGWQREKRKLPARAGRRGIPEEHTGALCGSEPSARPATLFSQLIFWTDLFVLSS